MRKPNSIGEAFFTLIRGKHDFVVVKGPDKPTKLDKEIQRQREELQATGVVPTKVIMGRKTAKRFFRHEIPVRCKKVYGLDFILSADDEYLKIK